MLSTVVVLFALVVGVNSFMISKSFKRQSMNIYVNSNKNENEAVEAPKKKFKISDLIQLIAMGAGAPGLGEFDRSDIFSIFFLHKKLL